MIFRKQIEKATKSAIIFQSYVYPAFDLPEFFTQLMDACWQCSLINQGCSFIVATVWMARLAREECVTPSMVHSVWRLRIIPMLSIMLVNVIMEMMYFIEYICIHYNIEGPCTRVVSSHFCLYLSDSLISQVLFFVLEKPTNRQQCTRLGSSSRPVDKQNLSTSSSMQIKHFNG